MRLLREEVVDRRPSLLLELKKVFFGPRCNVYDFDVDYKEISERIALLTHSVASEAPEIHELRG